MNEIPALVVRLDSYVYMRARSYTQARPQYLHVYRFFFEKEGQKKSNETGTCRAR